MNCFSCILLLGFATIFVCCRQFPRGPIPDSAGTSFRYIFTRNAHFAQNPYLKFYFINQDKGETATISFWYSSLRSNRTISWNLALPSLQFGFYQLNAADLVWQYLNDGIQRHPNTVIFVNSTVPIRLYASNFDLITNQADTVTVLPDSMANTNYVITLPTASRRIYSSLQYHIMHFLPVNFNIPTLITIKMAYGINKTVTQEFTMNDPKFIHYISQSGTVSRVPRTYYIEASQPILVAAAVTCTPISSGSPSAVCDFAAFMPPPAFKQDCNTPGFDISGSNTFNTKTFYLSSPIWNCSSSTKTDEELMSELTYMQNNGVIIVKNVSSKSYQEEVKVLQ